MSTRSCLDAPCGEVAVTAAFVYKQPRIDSEEPMAYLPGEIVQLNPAAR